MDQPHIHPASPPSPSLTQSASNSSSSPPLPSTPPPRNNRRQQRYPADLGRVPLHRRGRSKTYERLEDLLQEAGYKETRVFTPESERIESHVSKSNETASQTGKKSGMGAAVVGFLTGLVSGVGGVAITSRSSSSARQSSTEDDSNPNSNPDHSQTRPQSPLSPLVTRHQYQYLSRRDSSRSIESSEPQTPFMTSSYEDLGEPTPKPRYLTPSHFHQFQQPRPERRLSAAQRSLQKQASKSSIATTTNQDSPVNIIHQPRPSLAGTYLRPMLSTPDIQVRCNSTPVHSRIRALVADNDSNLNPASTTNSNSEDRDNSNNNHTRDRDESQPEPPLPKKWLDTVARAVLFGGGGNFGGPNFASSTTTLIANQDISTSTSATTTYKTLRSTRSSLSQTTLARSSKRYHHQHHNNINNNNTTTRRSSGLADHTNSLSLSPPLPLPPPPALFLKLECGRSTRSESQVIKTRVVCRSAPGSRTSSITRHRHHPRHHQLHGNDSGTTTPNYKEDENRGRGRNIIKTSSSSLTLTSTKTKNTTKNKTKTKAKTKKGKGKGKNRNEEYDRLRVPSLSRTRVECDGWYGYGTIPTTPISHLTSPSTSTSVSASASAFTTNPNYTSTSNLPSPFFPPNSSSSSSSKQYLQRYPTNVITTTNATMNTTTATTTTPTINTNTNTNIDISFSFSHSPSSSEYDSTSSEEGEGELNLAKMLVPPKRQQSIRSLRKHLTNSPYPNAPNGSSNAINASRLRISSFSSALGGTDTLVRGLRGRRSNLGQTQEDGEGLEWDQNWQRGGFGRRTSEDDEEEVQGIDWLRHERKYGLTAP